MTLNKYQKEAVYNQNSKNLIISASPGSGKTRTLVARALNKIDSLPENKTLALVTYTNAAADEINSRIITDKKIFIGTIHSFCLEYILKPFSWALKWEKPRIISYEEQEEFFEINPDIVLDKSFGKNKFEELNKIKRNSKGGIDTSVDWDHEYDITYVAEVYFDFLESKNLIDFNEILYRSYKLVSMKKFIPKSLSSLFYEILVDEFQDTNLFQYEILKEIYLNGKSSFFFVGDDKQKIFSFAGAIENSFLKAEQDFNAQRIELLNVYRSTSNIVEAYSKLFEEHPLLENLSELKDEDIRLYFFETDKNSNLDTISGLVKKLVYKYDIDQTEIAILSTSWFNSYQVSKTLRSDYNIVGSGALPHKTVSNSTVSLFKALSKYYVRQNIKNLRSIKRNFDLHVTESNLNYFDYESHYKTNKLITSFMEIDMDTNLVNGFNNIEILFNRIFDKKHSTFKEIIDLIKEEKELWTIRHYVKALSGINGITSSTIHKVKGLEFDAVILNTMNEKKIPYQKCLSANPWIYEELTDKAIEDGRNLFYVAVSRARKFLLTTHYWNKSMFLYEIN